MNQSQDPHDLVNDALGYLSLANRLPKFKENLVDDASVKRALQNNEAAAALDEKLRVCIPADKVSGFVAACRVIAKCYEPHDLAEKALASLSLTDRKPKFIENEVNDESVIKGLADTSALSVVLCQCIPAGRVQDFIASFKTALELRKQEEESMLKDKERRDAAEKARIDTMARDLPVLRLAIMLTETDHVIDGKSLLERLHSLGFTHDAALEHIARTDFEIEGVSPRHAIAAVTMCRELLRVKRGKKADFMFILGFPSPRPTLTAANAAAFITLLKQAAYNPLPISLSDFALPLQGLLEMNFAKDLLSLNYNPKTLFLKAWECKINVKAEAAEFVKGESDMIHAAYMNDVDVIAARAALGEDVNQGGGDSWTPLTYAAYNGKLEACELLLQLRADINKIGNKKTPLQLAVDDKKTSVAEFLRQRGGR